jgi:hypothetical protein
MINMTRIIRVTADSGANKKILKQLSKDGLASIDYINLENARVERQYEENIPATFILDVSRLDGGDVLGGNGETNMWNKLKTLLGGREQNLGDRRQLLGHFDSGNDIFVTEDKRDILSHKKELESLGIVVMSTQELDYYIRGKDES